MESYTLANVAPKTGAIRTHNPGPERYTLSTLPDRPGPPPCGSQDASPARIRSHRPPPGVHGSSPADLSVRETPAFHPPNSAPGLPSCKAGCDQHHLEQMDSE